MEEVNGFIMLAVAGILLIVLIKYLNE